MAWSMVEGRCSRHRSGPPSQPRARTSPPPPNVRRRAALRATNLEPSYPDSPPAAVHDQKWIAERPRRVRSRLGLGLGTRLRFRNSASVSDCSEWHRVSDSRLERHTAPRGSSRSTATVPNRGHTVTCTLRSRRHVVALNWQSRLPRVRHRRAANADEFAPTTILRAAPPPRGARSPPRIARRARDTAPCVELRCGAISLASIADHGPGAPAPTS